MQTFNQELLWAGAFFLLVTGIYLTLMQSKHALVPVTRPFIFLIAEVDVLVWSWYREWNSINRLTVLMSFVLVGLLLLYQTFAPRRWYIFHGGGFQRTMESYQMLAKEVSEFLWLSNLPPSTVILRYEGMLGLSAINDEKEMALLAKIDETLEETRWRKRGMWHAFFTLQWVFVISVLIMQSLV